MLNSWSNFVSIIHFEEIDGFIQKANEKTGLISDSKAKEIHQGIFKMLKKYNNFKEGFYNISANLGLNLLIKPEQLNIQGDADFKWFNDDNKGIKIRLYSNYMFKSSGAQSLQTIIFDSPLVSLRGSKESEGGTSNTFVGITLYDSDGNEILVKDFNTKDFRPQIFFKKKLFNAMTTCLYYNEEGNTIENTGIISAIENIDGEEYIKCIPEHLSSFTIGSYEKASLSPDEEKKEKDSEDNDKTVIIVVVCVIVGIALLIGGYFLYRYCRRRNYKF